MTTTEAAPSPVQAAAVVAGAIMRLDPQALMVKALESGAQIDVLERLMALAEQVRAQTAKEAYFAAKARFQAECPPIKKESLAEIQSRTGRNYSYKYSELGDITGIVLPILGKHGLSVAWKQQTIGANSVTIVCVVTHELGHQEESGPVEIPVGLAEDGRGANPAQRVGMAITYAKRYSLQNVLGIAPESDDDARSTGHGDDEDPRNREPEDRWGNGDPGNGGAVISEKQDRMFWGVAKTHGWSEAQTKALLNDYSYERSPEIRKSEFNEILGVLKGGPKR